MTVQAAAVAAARRHRSEHGHRILGEFADLLRIPNADPAGVEENAAAIAAMLARRGVSVEVVRRDGASPMVMGHRVVPGASQRIGFYAHYDGQPVAGEQWTHPPFQPTLCTAALESGGEPRPFPGAGDAIDPEWRIYARSSADDRAPIMALCAALEALDAAGVVPTVEPVLVFEGEEERGSEHLPAYLDEHRHRLDAEAWLICDGPVHASRRPQIVFGLRGITEMEITVFGPVRDLHSGHYGNWAPNPSFHLSRLLASMKDEQGHVLVETFYEGTAPVTDGDRAAVAALPDDDADVRADIGIARAEGDGARLVERMFLPSLNVRGLDAGGVGPAARNAIPAQARASIDIRLAPGNDPVEMLDRVERHLRRRAHVVVAREPSADERAKHPVIVRIDRRPGYPGSRVPIDTPLGRRLLGAAAAASGAEPVAMPTLGGSVPIHGFTEVLGRPAVIVPMANHDNRQHGPDENLRVGNLWYGIDLMAALLTMP